MNGPIQKLSRWLGDEQVRWIRSGWFVAACFVAVLVVAPLASVRPTPRTPGILEFELAGTEDGALMVLRAFDDAGVLARVNAAIVWDFVLILGYTIGLLASLEWIGRHRLKDPEELMPYAQWGIVIAGACDVAENASMLTMLHLFRGSADPTLGFVALIGALASAAKWSLVFAVVGYAVWEFVKLTLGKFWQRPNPAIQEPLASGPGGEGTEKPVAPLQIITVTDFTRTLQDQMHVRPPEYAVPAIPVHEEETV
jgi:hypothetical protein